MGRPSKGCKARGQGVGWLLASCGGVAQSSGSAGGAVASLGSKAWAGFGLVLAVLPKTPARQVVLLHHVGVVWRMTLKLLQRIASNFRNMETFAFRETPPALSAGVS